MYHYKIFNKKYYNKIKYINFIIYLRNHLYIVW